MNYKALIDDIAELQRGYARRREAAAKPPARPPAPLAKARPAPPPAPSKKEWKAFLRGHETLAKSIAVSLMETRIRRQIEAGRAQVARGEVTAHEAARLDAITHHAAALGIWR